LIQFPLRKENGVVLLVIDFTRVDGEGKFGGDTCQDFIIDLKVKNEDGTDLNNVGYHYMSTNMSSKADTDFVGTSLRNFIQKLAKLRKNDNRVIELIIWSDGGPAHFKSNQSQRMAFHIQVDNPNIKINWNFFVSYHGNNACDGFAHAVKDSITKKYTETNTPLKKHDDFLQHINKNMKNQKKHEAVSIQIAKQPEVEAEDMVGIRGIHRFEYNLKKQKFVLYENSFDDDEPTYEEVIY
jgi:hypothetical protein